MCTAKTKVMIHLKYMYFYTLYLCFVLPIHCSDIFKIGRWKEIGCRLVYIETYVGTAKTLYDTKGEE
jgi:hypothetical protein